MNQLGHHAFRTLLALALIFAGITAWAAPDRGSDTSQRARNSQHRWQKAGSDRDSDSQQQPQSPQRDRWRDPAPQSTLPPRHENFYRFEDHRGESSYHRGGRERPVNDVIRDVQRRYGGRVISVQKSSGGMYRVRVLQRDGRVRNLLVPAE